MKVNFSVRSLLLIVAVSFATLAVLLFAYGAYSGIPLLAVVCALAAGGTAGFGLLSTFRSIDRVGRQIERMSGVNPPVIELPDKALSPKELRDLVANLNSLIQRTSRARLAELEAKATLGELLAGTSHELNNPLAIVAGYADLLLEDSNLTGDQRVKLESIRRSAMRAASVVQNLLALARKREQHHARSDVNAIVEAACQLKEYDLRTGGILLEKNLAAGLPPVLADPHQIQQVLLHVINNAQDAAANSPSPRLAITTKATAERVIIQIEDSGADGAGKGAGLGMSITHGIIREHGGDIGIERGSNQGTRVAISLPAVTQFR